MGEGPSFHGSTATGGLAGRRTASLAAVMLVAVIGVLIAKPWATAGSPGSTATPRAASALPGASLPTTAPALPSAIATPGPSAIGGGFTTPIPPDPTAPWSALRWRRLTHDPLALVTSALRWDGGFTALGWVASDSPFTPMWTSTDGATWELLPFNTSTGFWPGTLVVGIAPAPNGLVALTESAHNCTGSPCSPTYVPPAVPWTSPDGRAWTPREAFPEDWLSKPTTAPPLLAVGPAGLVAASSGSAAHIATSTDGATWRYLPNSRLPASFWVTDLRGTATGYVAVGRWMTGETRSAASLWSGDGRHWPAAPTLLKTSTPAGSDVGSAIVSLVVGRDGIIAVGRGVTTPGATLWWQSPDGRRWEQSPAFGPLGPAACTGDGCGSQPDGMLAGDGRRMLAVRGGPDAAAWESFDGLSWHRLEVSGEIPGREATQATLLPGGVLVTDGSNTWFGEAQVP